MIKILAIMENENSNTDFVPALQDNGFQVEIAFPEQFVNDERGYDSYAILLCELAVAKDSRTAAYLGRWNGPILYLSRQRELPLRVKGFRLGIEDYLVHPFIAAELLLRVQMLLRCSGIEAGRKITCGNFSMDANTRTALAGGKEIPLTMREFNILFGLLSCPGKTFTRRELMREYWGEETTTHPRAVDVYMTKLREKFADCHDFQIITVHGIGYKAVLR